LGDLTSPEGKEESSASEVIHRSWDEKVLAEASGAGGFQAPQLLLPPCFSFLLKPLILQQEHRTSS
jgi:hypothetical protein